MSTTVQTRQVSEGGVTRSVASQSDARFGNTRKVTADNQAVSGTFVYDAFGTVTYSSGSPGLRNWYCGTWGYRDDGDTFASLSASAGLLHVGARYYDPTTGRFTTRDEDVSEDPYVYCDGDPVNLIDPDGDQAQTATLGGTLMAMLAAASADGPLPIGDPVAIGIGVGAVATIIWASVGGNGGQSDKAKKPPKGTGKKGKENLRGDPSKAKKVDRYKDNSRDKWGRQIPQKSSRGRRRSRPRPTVVRIADSVAPGLATFTLMSRKVVGEYRRPGRAPRLADCGTGAER